MDRLETDADLDAFPYGLVLWPSAIALAERLASPSSGLAGKRVLELGAGIGLPGLAAQDGGAQVTQTDHQPLPLALARLNARQNGVTGITQRLGDWRDFPPLPPFDLVVGSDILYERSLHGALYDLLPRLLVPGGLLLLSDPIRPPALDFADGLEARGWRLDMESRPTTWAGELKEIALFTARR